MSLSVSRIVIGRTRVYRRREAGETGDDRVASLFSACPAAPEAGHLRELEREDDMAGDLYGAYRAVITNTSDPVQQKRVQVRIPSVLGGATQWARVCRPFGAPTAAPRIGDEVLVVFEHGDPAYPYVIGGLW
jgi:uncharacterized protein involved in type VI secretion and phage assembly